MFILKGAKIEILLGNQRPIIRLNLKKSEFDDSD
jgi:hypothetical protein